VSESPGEKPLRTTSFVVHATRGLIRDQNARRKTMFMVVLVALVLLFSGSTFLQSALNPREHPVWFILFWLICAWLALTAMLLATFDMLMVRAAARKAERILRSGLPETETPDSPRSTTPKQSGLAKPFGVDE
jgi:protein-S-isoprenylcysteine O-methyltransferase Ste14